MQYLDDTNRNGLLNDCEQWTKKGHQGISGVAGLKAEFTHRLNQWYNKTLTVILESQDEWDFDDLNLTNEYPIATRALVADRRDYKFETALWSLIGEEGGAAASNAAISPLKVKRLDVCWNGTGNTCYKAEPIDSNELGIGFGNDTELDGRFSTNEPKYDIKSQAIWMYPRASAGHVSNSGIIRIEFQRIFDVFSTSDTTQEPGFDAPFHRYLSIGASYDWLLINKPKDTMLITRLEAMLLDYENRMREYYGSKSKDRQPILKPAFVDYE